MKGLDEAGKSGRRVPWHVTLFAGAAWFLLAGGISPSVCAVSGVMAVSGVLYILWPRFRCQVRDEVDADDVRAAGQLQDCADLVGQDDDPADGV